MKTAMPDRRTNAYRDDLAAASLKGQVDVPKYVDGVLRQVSSGSAAVRREPRHDAPLETEFLLGETVTIYEEREGWAWLQAEYDSYVGYVAADSLGNSGHAPTHRVAALRTHLYPSADIKAPPLDLLSMNARVAVEEINGRFARLKDGRFAIAAHLAPNDVYGDDFVAVAEQFLGTPYLWGGRTSIGLDCSALIQLSLQASGVDCPRDSDMQERALGDALPDIHDTASYRRGDLVFWKGHMGVMLDKNRLLHANAHHMAVAVEPVTEAIARIEEAEGPLTSVRRLS